MKELLKFIVKTPAVWLGDYPPFESDSANILQSNNYRLAPKLHNSYKSVWFYEELLSNFKAWKIILDEMIRLIDDEGYLVIRFNQNLTLNIIEIKQFLGRHLFLDSCVLEHEEFEEFESEVLLCFKVKRSNIEQYRDKSWSFIVLTQGDKVENVVSFCKSIRVTSSSNKKHEIIVCGPRNNAYNDFDVIYNETKYSDKYAEICKKKNDSIILASRPNILIAHDRYYLNDDFFLGFEKYGYDFNYLTISQEYISGKIFPSYLQLEKRMKWSPITYTTKEELYSDTVYVNGGLIISKKETLTKVKFNELLHWNQAEDVELSQAMVANSIPPRINVFSSAVTNVSDDYTKTFKEQPSQRRNFSITSILFKVSKLKNIVKSPLLHLKLFLRNRM